MIVSISFSLRTMKWPPHPCLPAGRLSLSPERLCRNKKNRLQTSWERQSGGKVLERQPFTSEFQTFHVLEMTPLFTSIDYPFLKDRILRLWNPTVSPTMVTIAI
jgi:hypothetical protein